MTSFDIRIMGVPERMEHIKETKKLLKVPDDRVFIDYEHEGVLVNAKRAWGLETKKSHVMVVQDDVEFCKDFMKYAKIIVGNYPDAIVALFPYQFRTTKDLGRYPVTPYVETNFISGQCIIMRSDYVKPCLESWKDNIGDDTNIQEWADANGIKKITTIPSIVQHVSKVSIYDPSRDVGRTAFYDPNPVSVKWENTFLNTASNIKRHY